MHTQSWDEKKIVLGVLFGSPVAEETFLQQELAKQRNFLGRLSRFSDPQKVTTLLRVCLGVQSAALACCFAFPGVTLPWLLPSRCHGSGIRGWTGELRKLWDMNIMYKTRSKGEVTTGAVRVVEEGAAGYGIWGR